jgi:hypothetical protein
MTVRAVFGVVNRSLAWPRRFSSREHLGEHGADLNTSLGLTEVLAMGSGLLLVVHDVCPVQMPYSASVGSAVTMNSGWAVRHRSQN